MSEIRPEVLKFAQLINDTIDRQQRAVAEGYSDFWQADKDHIAYELDAQFGIVQACVDRIACWRESANDPESRQQRQDEMIFVGYILCALANAWSVLDAPPKEQLAMALGEVA